VEVSEQDLLDLWQGACGLAARRQMGAAVDECCGVIAEDGVDAAGVFQPDQPVAQFAHERFRYSGEIWWGMWINVDNTGGFVDNLRNEDNSFRHRG
jgi:hypothetical protein